MKKLYLKAFILLYVMTFAFVPLLRAQTWSNLGTGADKDIYCFANYDSSLLVGGQLTSMNGVENSLLAYYKNAGGGSYYWASALTTGLDYDAFGGPYPGQYLNAIMAFGPNVNIGGNFTQQFYDSQINMAYLTWDDFEDWFDFSPYYDVTPYDIDALYIYKSQLYIGGAFIDYLGNNYIARVDSNDDFPLAVGNGLNGNVYCFTAYNGNLYAGGSFTQADSSVAVSNIAIWNGTSWSAAGAGVNGSVYSLTVYNNELIAGGHFSMAGSASVNNIAAWNGSSWSALGNGLSSTGNAYVYALEVFKNKLYAGGYFTTSGAATVSNIACWNGSAWSALGGGANNSVFALKSFGGSLFVGGAFTMVNTSHSANYIATYSDVVGIEEQDAPSPFLIPSPASQTAYIKSNGYEGRYAVNIYDLAGHHVKSAGYMNGNADMDIRLLAKGLYLIELKTESRIYYTKLVVQ